MEELKKFNVTIFGKSYVISTNELGQRTIKAAELVDLLMKNVASKTLIKDNYKIAVLVALQLANELEKNKEELKNWQNKTEDLELLLD
ncbi:cell division protein ZapA [Candidatus Dependentiae bacterium]